MNQEEFFGDKPKATVEEAPNPQALITVTQLPVIVQQLHLIKAQIENAVAGALAMEVTEENKTAAKVQLATLRKGIKALEEQRLAIRREILAPYDEMEAVYRACVTDVWKPAEAQLAGRIADIEGGLVDQKRAEVNRFFTELCTAHGLDFLTLEDTGVKVNLTSTVKALKAQCDAFVARVLEDMAMISTHALRAADILVEYKRNGFNAQRAVIDVNRRMDEADAERTRLEQLAAQREAQTPAEQALQAAAEEFPAPQPLAAPTVEPELQPPEKIYVVKFTVRGTADQMRALKQFLIDGGYSYE